MVSWMLVFCEIFWLLALLMTKFCSDPLERLLKTWVCPPDREVALAKGSDCRVAMGVDPETCWTASPVGVQFKVLCRASSPLTSVDTLAPKSNCAPAAVKKPPRMLPSSPSLTWLAAKMDFLSGCEPIVSQDE